MKKYSAKKKRRTCKKGGTQPIEIEVRFVKDINDVKSNQKYAIIYDYNGETKVYFYKTKEDLKEAKETSNCLNNMNIKNIYLIEYNDRKK